MYWCKRNDKYEACALVVIRVDSRRVYPSGYSTSVELEIEGLYVTSMSDDIYHKKWPNIFDFLCLYMYSGEFIVCLVNIS